MLGKRDFKFDPLLSIASIQHQEDALRVCVSPHLMFHHRDLLRWRLLMRKVLRKNGISNMEPDKNDDEDGVPVVKKEADV